MTTGEWEIAHGLPGVRWTWPYPLPGRSPAAFVQRAFKVSDELAALGALGASLLVLNIDALPHGVAAFLSLRITVEKALLLVALAASWNRAFHWLGLYRPWRSDGGAAREELARVATAASLGALPTLLFPLFSATGSFTLQTATLFWALSIPFVVGGRAAVRAVGISPSTRRPREVLIVGSGPRAEALCRMLRGPDGVGASLIGFVDSNERIAQRGDLPPCLGTLNDLESVLMRRVVDEVLIALPIRSCYERMQDVIHCCERMGVQCSYLADIFEPSLGRVRYEESALHTVKVVQDDFRLVIKRVVDLVGAALGLVFLAPLLLAIAVVIRLTSPGPALFTQLRYGLHKRLFRMFKFRTMVSDAERLQPALEARNEAQGPVFKIAGDPRVTRVGRFLRRTSLDELPQLWNVLKGEMSLVGPRPLPVRDVGRFDAGWLMRRFSMPPGLTCLWQVSGRSELDFARWVQLDLEYIDRWSLRLDGLILLRTIPAVLRGRGAQ